MESESLIAEIKDLVASAEQTVRDAERIEPTQLRIAVERLRLFVREHGVMAEPISPAEPVSEPAQGDETEPKRTTPKRAARKSE